LFEGQGLIVSVAADGQKIHVMTRDSADRTTAVGVIH
jgi:hypothetical protein